MVTLREALRRIDPNPHQTRSTKALAPRIFLAPPISVRNLIILSQLIWVRLAFAMQHQQQTNWCWAATAVSVSIFFNPRSTWTQCSLVNAELGRNDCCIRGSSIDCNKDWPVSNALFRTGNLRSWISGSSNLAEIAQEINIGRPICIRIGWAKGGAHFLVIDGYNSALGMVAVDDPWYGTSDVILSIFQTKYQGTGSWTDTYKVVP